MNARIDWDKVKNCSENERRELCEYIDDLIELKCQVEKMGIHGFDTLKETSKNYFEKSAAELIIQGCSPDMCKKILFNLISSSPMEPALYLKNLIFTEFCLMLQQGHMCNRDIKMILTSYLGVDCFNTFLCGHTN